MIKNVLTRRKESDTYLATVSRHRWSLQIAMKVDKMCSFQPALWPSSAEYFLSFYLSRFSFYIKFSYEHFVEICIAYSRELFRNSAWVTKYTPIRFKIPQDNYHIYKGFPIISNKLILYSFTLKF